MSARLTVTVSNQSLLRIIASLKVTKTLICRIPSLRLESLDFAAWIESLRWSPRKTALFSPKRNFGQGRGFHVLDQVTHRDHSALLIAQVLHVFIKNLGLDTHPRGTRVRNTMEIEDGNPSVLGLVHCPNQILETPLRSGVASNRDKQRIVFRRIVRRTSGPVVPIGKFRSHPPARKPVAFL